MKKFSRLRILLFTCIFTISAAFPASATANTESSSTEESSFLPDESTTANIAGWPTGPVLESEAAVVIEASTGTVLYDKNMNLKSYPASITKILTAVLGIENSSLQDMVYFSQENIDSVPRDSSHIAITPGEELSMENCLYGLLLASANECANAIAEHVSGSIPAFVDLMNARAKELGAINTHFANANGLPDENHYTTCYDMAMICRAAVSNETYRKINGVTSYLIPPTNLQPESRPVNSMHRLLVNGSSHYEGCFGGKTGYTSVAGSTLVTLAERNGMTLICVVMRSTSDAVFTESAALLDYGFQYFKTINVAENETNYTFDNDTFFPSSFSIFDSSPINIELSKDSVLVLPVSADFSDAKATLTFTNSETEEAKLADISYFYNNHYVGSASLNVISGDIDTFSFTKTTTVQPSEVETTTTPISETTTSNSEETTDTPNIPKYTIRINQNILLGGIVIALLVSAFSFYRHATREERERKKRIRRQQKRQFGTYSRLNMLYRPNRRKKHKNRKLKF